jgi:hypothetical protein
MLSVGDNTGSPAIPEHKPFTVAEICLLKILCCGCNAVLPATVSFFCKLRFDYRVGRSPAYPLRKKFRIFQNKFCARGTGSNQLVSLVQQAVGTGIVLWRIGAVHGIGRGFMPRYPRPL